MRGILKVPMSHKIQGILVALGLAAVFLSWQFLSAFKIQQPPITTADGTVISSDQILKSISSTDTDKDGLLDREESALNTNFQNPDTDGDGYLDGEEIATGHSPTIKGPNDFIDGFGGENLSQQLQEMVVSGLAEGSLKPSADSFSSSVATVADNLADKIKSQMAIPTPHVKITTDTYDNELSYARDVFPILQELPDNLVPQSEQPFVYSAGQKQKLSGVINTLKDIQTPQPWAQFHANLMLSIMSIDRSYTLLSEAEGKEDVITKIGINNQLIEILYTTLPNLYEKFFSMVEKLSS